MIEGHLAGQVIKVDRIVLLVDVVAQVENFEHPLKRHHGGGEFHPGVGQGSERSVQLTEQGGEHHDRANREGAVDHQDAADPENGRGAESADHAQGREEPTADNSSANAEITHEDGFLGEPLGFVFSSIEQLDQQGTADIEGLGEDRRHVGVVFHLLLGHPSQDLANPAGRVDEERQCRDRQQG